MGSCGSYTPLSCLSNMPKGPEAEQVETKAVILGLVWLVAFK